MTTLTGVHHLALTVSDADSSFAFYGALLGLEEAFQIDDETMQVRVFAGDGFLFGVRHYKSHDKDRFSEFRPGWTTSPSVSPTATRSRIRAQTRRDGRDLHPHLRDTPRTRPGVPRSRRHPRRVLSPRQLMPSSDATRRSSPRERLAVGRSSFATVAAVTHCRWVSVIRVQPLVVAGRL